MPHTGAGAEIKFFGAIFPAGSAGKIWRKSEKKVAVLMVCQKIYGFF